MPPGRKRTTPLPAHIAKLGALPSGVEYIAASDSFRICLTDGGKKHYKRLCDGKATLLDILQAKEAYNKAPELLTFATLSLKFQASTQWQALSYHTKKDYTNCHQRITQAKTKTGAFGSIPFEKWTPGTIRKYVDFRAQESKSRANKELSYIKSVMRWAWERDIIRDDFSKGIKKIALPPRQNVPERRAIASYIDLARQSTYWYMPYLLELCFQCRMRLSECLDLTQACEMEEGLIIRRRKGSRTNIIEWTDALRQTWEGLKAAHSDIVERKRLVVPIEPNLRYLFISDRTGMKLSDSAIETAKARLDKIARAKLDGFQHFTIHDLKRAGITYTPGTAYDKMDASGHKSIAMMQVYDLEIKKVKPAK